MLPAPRQAINFRTAIAGDYAFIDKLQKLHGDAVGFLQRPIIEKNIEDGKILIADASGGDQRNTGGTPVPLGYLISHDRYFKRDDVGIIYQLNVLPNVQRGLIGATLIHEAFERSSYSCKLYCCWCAQDLEANFFWESLGFVPLAFRTGSRGRGKKKEPRIHIFWQRRIREGDMQTPYWYPSGTSGGAVREERLVLPIPPGTHWSDAKPAVLPGMEKFGEMKALEGQTSEGDQTSGGEVEKPRRRRKSVNEKKAATVDTYRHSSLALSGLRFAEASPVTAATEVKEESKKAKPRKVAQKFDPKLVAAARELCGRYLDAVNNSDDAHMLPGAYGKYDVSRAFDPRIGSRGATLVAPMHVAAALDCDDMDERNDIIDVEVIESERKLLDAA